MILNSNLEILVDKLLGILGGNSNMAIKEDGSVNYLPVTQSFTSGAASGYTLQDGINTCNLLATQAVVTDGVNALGAYFNGIQNTINLQTTTYVIKQKTAGAVALDAANYIKYDDGAGNIYKLLISL